MAKKSPKKQNRQHHHGRSSQLFAKTTIEQARLAAIGDQKDRRANRLARKIENDETTVRKAIAFFTEKGHDQVVSTLTRYYSDIAEIYYHSTTLDISIAKHQLKPAIDLLVKDLQKDTIINATKLVAAKDADEDIQKHLDDAGEALKNIAAVAQTNIDYRISIFGRSTSVARRSLKVGALGGVLAVAALHSPILALAMAVGARKPKTDDGPSRRSLEASRNQKQYQRLNTRVPKFVDEASRKERRNPGGRTEPDTDPNQTHRDGDNNPDPFNESAEPIPNSTITAPNIIRILREHTRLLGQLVYLAAMTRKDKKQTAQKKEADKEEAEYETQESQTGEKVQKEVEQRSPIMAMIMGLIGSLAKLVPSMATIGSLALVAAKAAAVAIVGAGTAWLTKKIDELTNNFASNAVQGIIEGKREQDEWIIEKLDQIGRWFGLPSLYADKRRQVHHAERAGLVPKGASPEEAAAALSAESQRLQTINRVNVEQHVPGPQQSSPAAAQSTPAPTTHRRSVERSTASRPLPTAFRTGPYGRFESPNIPQSPTAIRRSGLPVRQEQAIDFFKSRGWTEAQAIGIVNNLVHESGQNLDPNAHGDRGIPPEKGGAAYGIAQWRADRVTRFQQRYGFPLYNHDTKQGAPFETQLDYIDWELKNIERSAGNRLRVTTTPQEASAVVTQYYERPKFAEEKAAIRALAVSSMITTPGDPIPPTPADIPKPTSAPVLPMAVATTSAVQSGDSQQKYRGAVTDAIGQQASIRHVNYAPTTVIAPHTNNTMIGGSGNRTPQRVNAPIDPAIRDYI